MTARKRSRRGPKRISPQQITGQQGVNFVEGVVLAMGFGWHPTNQALEAGIDGIIEIRDPETGEATNNVIQVQVKADPSRWTYETDAEFRYRCEPRDIDYWMRSNTPVILVAVRPEGGEGYWADVKATFDDPKRRKDGFLRFEKATQRFDVSAASTLMKLAVPRDTGPYMPATPHPETLISNLLAVESFPPNIYVASTEFREPQEIWDWARSRESELPHGWLLTEKSFRCVFDLREQPWADMVDRGSVECFDTEEWADSDDADRQREFVRLMNQVLREDLDHRGLWWSKKEKAFFFPIRRARGGKPLPRKYRYRTDPRSRPVTVATIKRHSKTDDIKYCRHHAIRLQRYSFERVAGRWYLIVTPHYVYTADGKQPYPFAEDELSGIKKREHQNAVLNQTLLWQRKLTEKNTGLFSQAQDWEPLIRFGGLLDVKCKRGLPDSAWLPGDTDHGSTEGGLFE